MRRRQGFGASLGQSDQAELGSQRFQGTDLLDPLEVVVIVEKDTIVLQDKLRYGAIRRATNRKALTPAIVVDPSGLSVRRKGVGRQQQILGFQVLRQEAPLPLVLGALQNFLKADDWYREGDPVVFEILQAVRCRGCPVLKQIDQDGRVDDNQRLSALRDL